MSLSYVDTRHGYNIKFVKKLLCDFIIELHFSSDSFKKVEIHNYVKKQEHGSECGLTWSSVTI